MRRQAQAVGGAALMLGVWGGACIAQDNAVLPPEPGATGACGQALSLTHRLRDPLDAGVVPPIELLLARSEPRYVEFSLATPAFVTLRTRSDTGSDTFLALYNASRAALASDDDSGGDLQALIEALHLPAGRYCAQVSLFGWSEGDAHAELLLETASRAPLPPPNTEGPCRDPALLADAGRPVLPGFAPIALTESVGAESRRDWRMTVAETTPVLLEASSAQFDTVLSLYDAAGRLIAENDDRPQGGTDSEIIQTLEPGDYCLSLRGFAGSGGPAVLTISEAGTGMPETAAPGPGLPCSDPTRTRAFAAPLAPGFGTLTQPGAVARDGVQDWRLELFGPMALQLLTEDTSFDTMLELFDPAGTSLAFNDDAPGRGTDSEIVLELAPGAYCLRVSGFAGDAGSYLLTVADTAAPAAGLELAAPWPDPAGAAVTELGLLGEAAEASLRDSAEVVWFGFTVEVAGPLRLQALSLGGPVIFSLLDADGTPIDQTSAGGGFDIGVLDVELAPGRYLAAIAWPNADRAAAMRQLVVTRR